MTRYRYRAVLLLFLLLDLTACQTWRSVTPTPMSVAQLIEEDRPDRVRVLTRGGFQTELERPLVDGEGVFRRLVAPDVSIPLADILRLEVSKIDWVRSALAGVVTFLVGMVVLGEEEEDCYSWSIDPC